MSSKLNSGVCYAYMRCGAAWGMLTGKGRYGVVCKYTVWSVSERVRGVREETLYKSRSPLSLPSSHRRHGQARLLVLSCPCRRCEQNNWRQFKTIIDRKFLNCLVQSWNAVRTTENSVDLSLILFTPLTTHDKTVLSCLVGGVNDP